jgi:hypothetical protein
MASETEKRLREEAAGIAKATTDLEDIINQVNEAVGKVYFGKNAQKGIKLVSNLKGEFQELFDQADRNADTFSKPFDKFVSLTQKFPLNRIFDNNKVQKAQEVYKEKITKIARQQATGELTTTEAFTKGIGEQLKGFGRVTKAIGVSRLAVGGLIGGFALLAKKVFDTAVAVDKAASSLVQTSGVLDGTFSKTLIEATEQATLLGGNVQLAADYASDFLKNISPSIPLTGKLVGNLAQVGEKLQIGSNTATKLTQIISELNNVGFETASGLIDKTISSLRLGPKIAKDLAASYDGVIDFFSIGLDSLVQQTKQANELGLSIGNVGKFAEGLLNLQSSISAEFKASAIIGQQINLQKARQLAFEGNIVGALNETLDQVEAIGGFEKLNFFQRKAIAEATGLNVSELQKEINLRRQLGQQAKIDAATRETALGKVEQITRRIQGAFFQVFASPRIQTALENFGDTVINFLESDRFGRLVEGLSNAVDFIGNLFTGGYEIDRTLIGGIPKGIVPKSAQQSTVQTERDLRDQEMIKLLKEIRDKDGNVYLDTKKVNSAMSLNLTNN